MSEITLGSSPNPPSNSAKANGADLAPIVIKPSRVLWRIECVIYGGILCAASIALFPFFLTLIYWPLVWSIFLLVVTAALRNALKAQKKAGITLSAQKKTWRLQTAEGEFTVSPFGEILLWSGVIILPVRQIPGGRKHRVVILPDSVAADDWQRLRVWLRTALKDNI